MIDKTEELLALAADPLSKWTLQKPFYTKQERK